jgi:hypothetical protein
MESATRGAMRMGVFSANRSAWTSITQELQEVEQISRPTDTALARAALHHSRRQLLARAAIGLARRLVAVEQRVHSTASPDASWQR